MQTRRQDPATARFRQEAFSSSTENDRGILGNLVAARCHKLTDAEDIAMLWWLQQISWRDGDLEKFAGDFLRANRAWIGTPTMLKIGTEPGRIYSADQVRTIRAEMDREMAEEFPLRGERSIPASELDIMLDFYPKWVSAETAETYPASYSADEFVQVCLPGEGKLTQVLQRSLVDPQSPNLRKGIGYFPSLFAALLAWRDREIESARAGLVETEIVRQINEELDFALETRSFVLIEGREGIGKSEGAKAWCGGLPGRVIYIRLESGSDESTLLRSISRRVGTACSYTRKISEMKARIQDTLQAGHLMLVIDEAHFLWPQGERVRRSLPSRIDWLRTSLIDFGVPVALISTPQFFARQCERFRRVGWNANQIQRRVTRTALLPEALSAKDALAVARHYFPGLPEHEAKLVAGYSLLTLGYLGTIAHLRKRVNFFLSRRAGVPELELVKEALQEIAPESAITAGKDGNGTGKPAQPGRVASSASSNGPSRPSNQGARRFDKDVATGPQEAGKSVATCRQDLRITSPEAAADFLASTSTKRTRKAPAIA